MTSIDARNAAALAARSMLLERNDFGIRELLSKPPFWGWVPCANGADRFDMLLGGADDAVALRFFWNGGYERTTLAAWAWFARRGGCIVDIGAHTGAYTLAAFAAARGTSPVLSFEPHFMNFARLNLNLRANGFPTANAFMLGVGARSEILPFTIRTSLDYLTTGGTLGAAEGGFTRDIQVVALDEFLARQVRQSVRLVKIDVEGFEGQCLAGMSALLEEAGPTLFFECIERRSGAEVQAILEDYGYRFHLVDDSSGAVVEVGEIEPQLDAAGRPLMHRLNRVATRAAEPDWPARALGAVTG
ncbi:MAG: FkbM family methyltransferase [Burkholderiales bacterium]